MSLDQKTFMDLSLRGEVSPDQIDEFVDIWHEGGTGLKLSEFLGFTGDEYSLWVEKPSFLKYIFKTRQNRKSITDYCDQSDIHQLVGQNDRTEDVKELIDWLEQTSRIEK